MWENIWKIKKNWADAAKKAVNKSKITTEMIDDLNS